MVWSSTWPDGSKSVKANEPTGTANTTYIKTTSNVDHFWDVSATKDGHHNFVQMPQQGTPASPTDAALATGMDGAIFLKSKAALDAVDNVDVQPFMINNKTEAGGTGTNIMQIVGMRACACFDVDPDTDAVSIKYAQNVTSIVRSATKTYTVTYAVNLPTVNYIAQGGGVTVGSVANNLTWQVTNPSSGAVSAVKGLGTLVFNFTTVGGTVSDPYQGWFWCFGG